MEKPIRPVPSHEYNPKYSVKYTEKTLISKHFIPDEDLSRDEYLDRWKESCNWKEGDFLPEVLDLKYDTPVSTLAELLAKIPAGTDPSKVIISLHRDRHLTYIEFSVKVRNP